MRKVDESGNIVFPSKSIIVVSDSPIWMPESVYRLKTVIDFLADCSNDER